MPAPLFVYPILLFTDTGASRVSPQSHHEHPEPPVCEGFSAQAHTWVRRVDGGCPCRRSWVLPRAAPWTTPPEGSPAPGAPRWLVLISRVVARPSLTFPLAHPVVTIINAHVWNMEQLCKAGARNHSPATSPLPAAPLSSCDRTQSVELTQGLCLHVTRDIRSPLPLDVPF